MLHLHNKTQDIGHYPCCKNSVKKLFYFRNIATTRCYTILPNRLVLTRRNNGDEMNQHRERALALIKRESSMEHERGAALVEGGAGGSEKTCRTISRHRMTLVQARKQCLDTAHVIQYCEWLRVSLSSGRYRGPSTSHDTLHAGTERTISRCDALAQSVNIRVSLSATYYRRKCHKEGGTVK